MLAREEIARLINAAGRLFRRTLLITLYGTGMWRAELARPKASDIEGGVVRNTTGLSAGVGSAIHLVTENKRDENK
jgi:hypothetical protein